ncbi:transcriptional regulator [Pseudomonas sp. zfem002]|uniref:transcriptional regulator n=1 Tax=Pseudomonas sp. zfem002 TaxID=3078197 RepID=UPI002928C473|nr:transcriptional regulator [Pseudomonas sp. zfem002]MDU9390371.1 transcriptional regulator [Pseudomonas sp. zfem002]
MFLRTVVTALAFVSLPLMASANELPTGKEIMEKNQAQIQNNLDDADYKRKVVVKNNMGLEGAENETFWPIYNTYRAEAVKINKKTLEAMIDYGQAYDKGYVTDELATDLLNRIYVLQEDHIELREKYTRRLADKVSPKRAMRFLQIETQLDAMQELEVSRRVPLAE